MSKLVSIFVCGVQKCGTTSLHAYFREHPALSPPSRQGVHFFDEEARDWAAPDYTALDSLFATDDGDRLRFDITPIYIFWPRSIERIRAYNPSAKLIFLFRDPFERAWSQWCMEYARGDEKLPFAEAIRTGRSRLESLPPLARERRVYTYIERGLYAEQVRRVLAIFPRGQLLFLRSRDFLGDHVEVLNRISSFLGVASFPDTGPKRERQRPRVSFPSCPTEEDRAFAASLVRNDVREFSALTGLKVSDWPTMR
ncbi:MAG: sulfotransferase [Methylocella sp.]